MRAVHWRQLAWPAVCAGLAALLCAAPGFAQSVGSLRVMSFNILGGSGFGQPLARTIDVIRAADADVIGIQETGGVNAIFIASALGFHNWRFGNDISIVSRYPIAEVIANQGVKLQLSPTQEAYVFDAHLQAYPYQPYDVRDGLITTEAQAIASAQATRGAATAALLNNMSSALATGDPVFLTGDFNEPSHLDWTQVAANAGLNFGKKVAWPTSTAIVNAGLTDAFRALRPDEVNDRGLTWTPGYPPPLVASNEVHDRIDMVYFAGTNVTPTEAQLLGFDADDGNTDIALDPYPSDHRAVVVEFAFSGCGVVGDVNSDCALNAADWVQFRSGQQTDMTGFTAAQAYAAGDLTGDLANNHADFVLFKDSYEAAYGAGSFARLLTVPEPESGLSLAWLVVILVRWQRALLDGRRCRTVAVRSLADTGV